MKGGGPINYRVHKGTGFRGMGKGRVREQVQRGKKIGWSRKPSGRVSIGEKKGVMEEDEEGFKKQEKGETSVGEQGNRMGV